MFFPEEQKDLFSIGLTNRSFSKKRGLGFLNIFPVPIFLSEVKSEEG